MKYLIDTNICIYIMNKRPKGVIQKFKQFDPGEIGVSTITVSELQYGAAKSTYQKENQLRLTEFLTPLEIAAYDEIAAQTYGAIRAQLEREGRTIGPLDLLIAAHALSLDIPLITNNPREFKRIKTLTVENWTQSL
ncbi:MAG: type II toxin-antitoxin system VapC family toxin [Desulfobacterales bacterium]